MGDVVNLAARLKDHAEAGEILVEEATHRHTHGAFEFTPRTLDVEGYDEPIQAYRAERLLPRPVRVRGIKGLAADLIGRDDELRQLKLALAKTAAGEGQIASIIGEAGVGKSRLAKELRTHATSEDSTSRVLWMEGHCVEIGVSAGYWPFIDMLTHHFGWTSEDDNATRADIVRGALSELVSLDLLTPQRRVDIGACLGRLLSVRFGDEWDERLKSVRPEQIQRQTFTAIRDFVIAVARRQPVVLVLDDLHWADNHSLDLISVMMEALTLAPVMLLCLYRSERDHASSQLATWASRTCPDQYTELALRELTTQESHRLVDSMLDIQDLPQATRDSIVDKCQGNPFFVEEVVRSLVHSGEVYEEDGVWKVLDTAETVGVPDSVHGMILSRVDTLEQGLKDVVHTACVIGRLFRRSVLEHIMQTEADIEGALAQLEDHGIIYRHRVIPEPQYSFRHTLTQEAVYETLLRSHKESVHRRAAEALEVLYQDDLEQYKEELAHHYERSDHDAKAVEYLLGAGHKARSACLNDEAIAYYERCLDTLTEAGLDDDHPDWRVSALGGLTRILVGVGRAGDAEKYGRDAVALAKATGTSRAETVRLLFWLAEALQSQSRYDDVMGIAEEGLALLADDTESVGAVLMNHQMAAAARNRGLLDLSLKHTTRNAQFIRDLPYTEELGAAYIQVAVGCMLADRDDEAARWLKTARELAEKHHDQHLVGDIALQTGAAVGGRGDLRAAVRYFSEAADISAKTGDATLGAWSVGGLAWVHLSLGELDHAERHIAEAASIAEKMGHRRDLAIALDILGTAMLGQGRAAEAVQTFHRAASLHEEIGSPQEAAALLSLGRAEMAAGEVDAAEEHLRRAALGGGGETVVVAAIAGLAELISEQDIAELAEKVHAHDESVRSVRLVARPAEATPFSSLVVSSDLSEVANDPAWTWHDLYDDCAYRVGGGCVISAANGRALGSSDLWIVRWQNVSAPRFLRGAEGDFAMETRVRPTDDLTPAIGGLLLRQDRHTYLRLDVGAYGARAVTFQGCQQDHDQIHGRGGLRSGETSLRLERTGATVRALFREDDGWHVVAEAPWTAPGPARVGLFAIGAVNRLIYPGAFQEGSAIHFDSFEMWR